MSLKLAKQLGFYVNEANLIRLGGSAMNLQLDGPLTPLDKVELVSRLADLNKKHHFKTLFPSRRWSPSIFDGPNLPRMVGKLNEPSFTKRDGNAFHWITDLPVKMPGKGWRVPQELQKFTQFLTTAEMHEKLTNPYYESMYAYLCVDERDVNPNTSQRREGWHSDSIVTKDTHSTNDDGNVTMDSIYLAYSSLPTEFTTSCFKFPSNMDQNNPLQLLKHFDSAACDEDIVTFPSFNVIHMDPRCVHRVAFNTSDNIKKRTFAKLVFSSQLFNREGNDTNHLFDYDWYMVPRTVERNVSSIVSPLMNNIKVTDYQSVDSKLLCDNIEGNSFNGIMSCSHSYNKSSTVTAYPATLGEFMQTSLNGFTTSVNYAKDTDWKVTTSLGDQYFLPYDKLCNMYTYDAYKKVFVSKPTKVLAAELTVPVKFKAPWGHPQYLIKGDYIVKRLDEEPYGVKRDNFQDSYVLHERISDDKMLIRD